MDKGTPATAETFGFDGFKTVAGRDAVRETDGIFSENGGFTRLGILLSDQCPTGVRLELPDGSTERVAGTAVTQALRASEIVNRHNPKVMVEGTKTPVNRYPRIAVREVLTNAVVHRDYDVPEDICVRFVDGAIEVRSPGEAPARGMRNPDLARIVDKYDTKALRYRGTVAVRRSYARSGYEPLFSSGDGAFTVLLPAVESVRGHYNSKKDKISGYLLERDGGASLEELADLIGYSKVYTRRVLNYLTDDGVIMHMNYGPLLRYYLCKRRRRSSLPHTGQNSASLSTLE